MLTGLKIFSVFYGLKLIKPNLSKLKLTDEQKAKIDDENEDMKETEDNVTQSTLIRVLN